MHLVYGRVFDYRVQNVEMRYGFKERSHREIPWLVLQMWPLYLCCVFLSSRALYLMRMLRIFELTRMYSAAGRFCNSNRGEMERCWSVVDDEGMADCFCSGVYQYGAKL